MKLGTKEGDEGKKRARRKVRPNKETHNKRRIRAERDGSVREGSNKNKQRAEEKRQIRTF
jgi:hypothetical protein